MSKTWQHQHAGFQVLQLATLKDNYTYMVLPECVDSAWVIDPADAATVITACKSKQRTVKHIWNTHHHWDHTDGNTALQKKYGCSIHAAECEKTRIPTMTHGLSDHDQLTIDGLTVDVLAVAGHTDGHLAFLVGNALFCGDVLFSAGCGRLFEGTPAQMLASLQRLSVLPDDTMVYCAHEYTAMNLQFALAVADSLPDHGYQAHCLTRQQAVLTMRANGQATIPVALAAERWFNPFLQVWEDSFQKNYAAVHATACSPLAVFTHMRQWRNDFVYHA